MRRMSIFGDPDGVLCVGIFSNTPSVTEKITLLETLAVNKTYRGFVAASANPTASHPVSAKQKTQPFGWVFCFGDPDGIRTRVTAVKGRCLRPLDHRAIYWWL